MTPDPKQATDADEDPRLEPNLQQHSLIGQVDGPVLVDAGAGTGKTFTVARRYLEILDTRDADPRDVLLITFTNNAAEEMRERILHLGDLSPARLRDAPILTFHSLAKRILERHGFDAPAHLGIDEPLAPNFRLLENQVLEAELFEAFVRTFRDEHPEHRDRFRALYDPTNLLDLIKTLAAKGVFPTREGWYRDGEAVLDGDWEAFQACFEEVNAPRGGTQSKLRDDLRRWKHRVFLPDAPTSDELRGTRGTKRVDPGYAEDAFHDDRAELKAFLHDVYLAYLETVLERNALNFPFLLLFAYVLLVEDDALLERLQYDYVMIDEFQDTSEIQLQLALLFCAQPNLCCVGDWKQSIYSFQYASVDNILDFKQRVRRYAGQLNEDTSRVPDPAALTDPLVEVPLVKNYRSTQAILDLAKEALVTPGTRSEQLDEEAIGRNITELESTAKLPESRIEALACEDEVDAVLAKVTEIIGEEAYALVDEDALDPEWTRGDPVPTRTPSYDDVAVLTRTRSFALDLQARARELGIPVAFEGGVEVYATDAGKLLLAWLRLLEDPSSDRGWAVVLEAAGYPLDEAENHLETGQLPEDMLAFREQLAKLPTVGAQARAVFERYDLHDGFTEALVRGVQSAYDATRRTPAEIVRFLEDNLEAGTTEPVDDHPGGDVLTVQTIHAAKGLEYPIVILADVNQQRFPSSGGGYPSAIRYQDPAGLRARKIYAEPDGRGYVYDHWPTVFVDHCLPSTDHDEERRLLYVALSRAEQHLVVTADRDRPSSFFEHLPIEPERYDPDLAEITVPTPQRPPVVQIPTPSTRAPRAVGVNALVEAPDTTGGRGRAFGKRLHRYAARRARGQAPEPSTPDETNVDAFLEQLDGDLEAEVPLALPVHLDGLPVVLEGTLDLLATSQDEVHVVDWKTAPPKTGFEAHARQVGLYAHVVQRVHADKRVVGWVVYTQDGTAERVDPLPEDRVLDLLRAHAVPEDPPPQPGG